MVLETTWHTPTGWMTVQDMLVMGPRHRPTTRGPQARRPATRSAQGTLLRIATCFGGRVEIVVNCLPMFDYGREAGVWIFDGDGYDRATVGSG